MLVETLMARDDDPGFEELVAIAVETGREGVKALKAKEEEPAPAKAAPAAAQPQQPMAPGDHMKIGLTRIDDRLIHGQVATRWTKETNVNRIIVVSDEVAKDHVRKTLLTQVAPPGVTAHVVDVDKMVRVWNNPKYGRDRVMLLFTNPTDVLRVVEQGVDIKTVNIGGMAFRQGKTQVNNAVSVDEQDIAAFRKLNERNIELEVRKVSNDPKLKMMDLIAKVNA
jgi:PTS system mannose-specific IIB component